MINKSELKIAQIYLLTARIKRLRQDRKDDLADIRECKKCILELKEELKSK